MAEIEEFEEVVRELACARVRGDVAAFASFLTPQALLALHRDDTARRRPREYRLIAACMEGDSAASTLQFVASASYQMELSWRRVDGGWKVIDASIPEATIRWPWWRRWLRIRGAGRRVERKDLA